MAGKARRKVRERPMHFRASKQVKSPERALRARRLTEFAKKVIRGEKSIAVRKMGPVRAFAKIPAGKERRIIALLAENPLRSNHWIANQAGVRPATVEARRQILQERGTIKEVSKREKFKKVQRNPAKITGYLNANQRARILEQNSERIKRKAIGLYNRNKPAFDFKDMLLEDVVDELVDGLDWQLQTYHPDKMPKPEETKLERYFNKRLVKIAAQLKRSYWKQFKRIGSLEALEGIKKSLEARPKGEEITVEEIENVVPKMDINVVESAVLFALAANMPGKMIARELGYSPATVTYIKATLEKKLVQLVQAQKEALKLKRG